MPILPVHGKAHEHGKQTGSPRFTHQRSGIHRQAGTLRPDYSIVGHQNSLGLLNAFTYRIVVLRHPCWVGNNGIHSLNHGKGRFFPFRAENLCTFSERLESVRYVPFHVP